MHKRQNLSSVSVHHGKLHCHFCTILLLVFNWSHTFFAGICAISEAGPVSSACPPPNVIWQNKSFSAHANEPAEGSSWAYELSCGGGNITRSAVAACVSGYRRREEDVCHVSFVCCAFSSLYARSSGVWPVCPAPSWLFYFTLCL